MRTVVVVPTYQERDNVENVLGNLLAVPEIDVLIVDDSSPDGTGEAAHHYGQDHGPGRVSVLTRPPRSGLGAAYRAGFTHSLDTGYDIVVQMDADGSHPVSALPTMIELVRDGYDLVLGSRYCSGGSVDPTWPIRRRLLSRGGNQYSRIVLRSQVSDLTGGFKAWHADTLRAVDPHHLTATGYAFQIQGTIRALDRGARVAEIPIHFTERQFGTSKMHAQIIAEATVAVLQLARGRGAASRSLVGASSVVIPG